MRHKNTPVALLPLLLLLLPLGCDALGGTIALANEPGQHAAALAVRPSPSPRAPATEPEAEAEVEPTPPEPPGELTVLASAEPAPADAVEPHAEPAPLPAPEPLPTLDAYPDPLPDDLSTLDQPYAELIKKFRKPLHPGSVGTTLRGRLHNAAELPLQGAHHAVLPDCLERETRFGTPDLVHLLLHAAEATHTTHGGPRLMIGNLSQDGGGNISWSRSHNSGLDADLSFFVLKDGQPEEAPTLMRFGGRLNDLDELGYTFDVPRNWTLVKSLLTHPTVQPQWLFIARPLRRALLEHARAQGEPADLLLRAETIMRQPMDAKSHNDHLHVRIFCPARDRVEGCLQQEPVWPWVETQQLPTLIRAAALAKGLQDPKRELRAASLDKLGDLPGYFAAPAVAAAWLGDPSDTVRQRSWELLLQWDDRGVGLGSALEDLIRAPGAEGIVQDDPDFTRAPQPRPPLAEGQPAPLSITLERRDGRTLRAAWRLVGALGPNDAAPLVIAGLRSRRVLQVAAAATLPEPLMAAEAARHLMDLRLVPALLDTLDHPEPDVREAAARALERLANHELRGHRWDAHAPEDQRHSQRDQWRAWWSERAGLDRDALLLQGFQQVQPAIRALDPDATSHLIHLTQRKDAIGYNADRALHQITGRWAPRDTTAEARYKHWSHASAEAP